MSRAIKCKNPNLLKSLVLETLQDYGGEERYTLDSALHVAVKTGELDCVLPIAEKVDKIT